MKYLTVFLRGFVVMALGYLSFRIGDCVGVDKISGLLDSILTVAGLLFAVFGAWLSLLSASMLKVVESNEATRLERYSEVDRAALLVSPMTAAAVMVVIGLIIKFALAFSEGVMVSDPVAEMLKREVVFIFSVTAFYQIWYLLHAVVVGIGFVINLDRAACDKSSDNS